MLADSCLHMGASLSPPHQGYSTVPTMPDKSADFLGGSDRHFRDCGATIRPAVKGGQRPDSLCLIPPSGGSSTLAPVQEKGTGLRL